MIAILGGGELGEALARALSEKGEQPLCLVPDERGLSRMRTLGMNARRAPHDEWAACVPQEAGAAFVVTGSDPLNSRIVSGLRKARPDLLVLAEAGTTAASKRLKRAGADFVLESKRLLATTMLDQITELENQRAARRLVAVLGSCRENGLAVFLHDDPDPDSIASAMAIKRICAANRVPCALYHGGEVSRPENALLVSLLGARLERLPSAEAAAAAMSRHDRSALIESSIPGQNNILPPGSKVDVIIDHHPLPKGEEPQGELVDIRPDLGAAATILTGYLRRLWIRPDPPLASALLYAIKVDTNDLTRHVDPEDLAATVYLAEHADLRLIQRFESPPMPGSTAEVMARAILDRELFSGHLLACAGVIRDREALARAAEFLVRLEGVSVAVVFGLMKDKLYLSARSSDPSVDAGRLLHAAFGKAGSAGGHAASAGAQIPLSVLGRQMDEDKREQLAKRAVRRLYLRAAGIAGGG